MKGPTEPMSPHLLIAALRTPKSGPRAFLILVFFAAFSAVTPEVWARGNQEDPLVVADRLIESQDYNEAIIYLTEFIRKHPERFDEAQARLKRVIEIREAYNKKAKGLLDILVNEPTNEEKKLALIKELEALERSPNKETLDFIARTKEASLFVYNRAKFEEIMNRGRTLIDGKKYAEAAKAYGEGFTLYRAEFDAGPYDAITKSAVASLVERIRGEVVNFSAEQSELTAAASALTEAFRQGDPLAVVRVWPRAEAAYIDHARRRNNAAVAGYDMERYFETIKKIDNTTTDSSFLPFAFRFTLGRSTSALPEGITGAMDSQWIELLNGAQVALEESLDSRYAAAEQAYSEGRWEESAAGFDTVAALASPGLSCIGLWSLVAPTDLLPEPNRYGKTVLSGKATVYERVSHLARTALAHGRLARLSGELETAMSAAVAYEKGLSSTPPLAETLAGFAGRRKDITGLETELAAERPPSQRLAEELARWNSAGYALASSGTIQGSYDGRLAAALDEARGAEVSIVAAAGKVEFENLSADYTDRGAALAEGRRLLEGIASTDSSGLVFRYPTKSATLLSNEEAALAGLRSRIADFIARNGKEIPYVAGSPAVQIWEEQARQLDQEVVALQTERKALFAKAEEQRRAAESARLEAERRVSESKRALANEDFDQARDRLDKARDRYLASFSLEEDPKLRTASDAALQLLGEEIVRAENEKVIRDTRRLITDGKTLYFQGSFDRAEDSLLRARARWKTTNGEVTNPEVEYWLRLIQAALSVKSGRDIPATAPLYPEMSQLISLAKKYFEDGRRLLNERRKTDALQAFALAKQKINEVKVVFPLNEEAGVLSLKIDQLIDPDAFRQVFGAKFSASRAKLDVNPREAYSELQDLAAIDPRYPGLSAALDRAEILLGIKIPPPDPTKIRRARELVAAARRVVDAGDRTQFPFALEQLNEAIELDPNNDTAVSLKDRILTYQGGSAQIVLSSAAEAQYQQAVSLFQDGNTLQALGIVERLLQDANNKRSQKLLDLYKKIQARL